MSKVVRGHVMVYKSECTHMNTIEIAEGVRMCENPVCRRLILTDYTIEKQVNVDPENWWE